MDLTSEVKEAVLGLGASLVGIAGADRFDGAPKGHRPEDLLPGARAVVVMGVQVLESISGWNRLFRASEIYETEEQRIAIAERHFYGRSGYETINIFLEQLGLRTALHLEGRGHRSMYFPATFAHHAPIMEKIPGYHAPFSHRHAAVRAGLGEFGLNNLVLTRRFGPRVRFMSVITGAPLAADPLPSEKLCLGASCRLCVEACAVHALRPIAGRDDASVWLDMPTAVDKPACYFKHDRGADCWGFCMDVCPVGRDS
jgi:epoxyqueuosine reductase